MTINLARAYLALRAEVEELKQENQDQAEELASSGRVRLRAELAAAKEEIGKLERDVEFLSSSLAAQRSKATLVESALAEANSHIAFVYRERDAERAARKKAEARVRELENQIVKWYGQEDPCPHPLRPSRRTQNQKGEAMTIIPMIVMWLSGFAIGCGVTGLMARRKR